MSARVGYVSVTGKGNKYREVPLNITVRKMMEQWMDVNSSKPLFPNRYGSGISTRGVFKMVDEYA